MGRKIGERDVKSHALPPYPAHLSSSSSDFEFTVSLSPPASFINLCPADDLFYKGQLLPLHLSPRLSMVRTLRLASSSSDATTTAFRDSTASSHSSFSAGLALLADCDSPRPSSDAEEDFHHSPLINFHHHRHHCHRVIKKSKYLFSRFSSVFRRDPKARDRDNASVKCMSATAREVARKYLKKVKPFYEKLPQEQQPKGGKMATWKNASFSQKANDGDASTDNQSTPATKCNINGRLLHSFSGNLRCPRKRRSSGSCASRCPSSMMPSPSHSSSSYRDTGSSYASLSSSAVELQSAIQGAIAHCKNSMVQKKTIVVHGLS